jgi:hypothetical protein
MDLAIVVPNGQTHKSPLPISLPGYQVIGTILNLLGVHDFIRQ